MGQQLFKLGAAFTLVGLALGFISSDRADAQIRDWNTGSGDWSNTSNWNPSLLPGFTDIARIGILPAVHDDDVLLNADTVIAGLQIYDGMRVQTNGHNVATSLDTLITGSGSRSSELNVEDNSTFTTRHITNDARLRLSNNGTINVGGQLDSEGLIYGGGTVNFTRDSGVAFSNDGTVMANGSPLLTFNQLGNGEMDLDGSSGDGIISLRSNDSTFTFNGTGLTDTFDGVINLRPGAVLNMNFSDGWTVGTFGEINLVGDELESHSQLNGGDLTMHGNLSATTDHVFGTGSHLIGAPTRIGSSANVSLEAGNSISFDGPVTIDGGNFSVEEDAQLSFNTSTVVNGGSFATHSQLSSDGVIEFNGTTAWQGDANFNGIVRQNGNVLVTGDTTIDAGVLDMDGDGNTNWNISRGLVVNADGIDSTISNSFDGSMQIYGAVSSKLTVNLNQPDAHWTMAGEMDLSSGFNVGINRVEGSEMRVTGDLNVDTSTGGVGIAADLTLDNSATVTFANPTSMLFLQGSTRIEQNASFIGEGTLLNDASGHLTLADGVSLDNVDLVTYGIFDIGDTTGIANVDDFEIGAGGIWELEIGGHLGGDEFDVLTVDGSAMLDGFLDVGLIDAGSGLFMPELGDEFTILTSLGGVSGEFEFDPISFSDGMEYQWEVLYNPHNITLRVASISAVPEPGVFNVLLVFGLATFSIRRRSI